MFFHNIFARIGKKQLRRILRGHRILKQSDRIWRINVVNESLTTANCIESCEYSKTIFGAAVINAELAVRQYLLMRLAGVRLGKAILYAGGKSRASVVYPLPPEWRKVVRQQGFQVATVRSVVCWNALVALFLAHGIVTIGRMLLQGIKEMVQPSFPMLGRYVFFDRLSENNLPRTSDGGLGQEIISWYQQWSGRANQLDSVCHTVEGAPVATSVGVRLLSLRSAIPPLTRVKALFSYLEWGVAAITIAALDLLRGRWWHAVMLGEASKAALVRMHQPDQLARDYLFHNSGWIYRPLWTYEAEVKQSRVIFYFYSTNCEGFQRPGSDPLRAYYGYHSMAWPYYLVWDTYQADFVRRVARGIPRIDVVGSIPFSTSIVDTPHLPTRTIAVFDVQPLRDAFYKALAPDLEYYTAKTANQFLSDVYEVLKEANCSFVLKRKRDIGNLAHPAYRNFVDKLAQLSQVTFIDSSLAATKVIEIENCIAVISMPFTSTALLAQVAGKPSIYYDPNGQLQKRDPAAHGIEILSGQEELRRWLTRVLENHA